MIVNSCCKEFYDQLQNHPQPARIAGKGPGNCNLFTLFPVFTLRNGKDAKQIRTFQSGARFASRHDCVSDPSVSSSRGESRRSEMNSLSALILTLSSLG